MGSTIIGANNDKFWIAGAKGGLLITSTQIGYALGILLIVPLGDFVQRKRLITTVMSLSIIALISCIIAPSFTILSLSLFSMGIVTVSGQILIPLTGDLSEKENRGQMLELYPLE